MARGSKRQDLDAADLDRLATALVETIRGDGSLPLSKLAAHGVPKAARQGVLERCAREGLEVGARLVRVPLQDQLRAHLRDGASLSMRALPSAVRGATKKEATETALALVRSGEATLVLRGTEVTFMPATARVIEGAEMMALDTALSSMIKTIKAARKAKACLLASDIQEALARLRPMARAISLESVLEQARKLALDTGLTFVPTLVGALGGEAAKGAVHELLATAARRGLVELRPESGLGRLSEEELALCIPGPQGSRLSWARTLEAR